MLKSLDPGALVAVHGFKDLRQVNVERKETVWGRLTLAVCLLFP